MMKNISKCNTEESESEFMTAMKFITVEESNPDVVIKGTVRPVYSVEQSDSGAIVEDPLGHQPLSDFRFLCF